MMNGNNRPFEVTKTFGISVLLKLTKKYVPGIVISENHGRFTANVSMDELNDAVTMTMKRHNINLRLE